MHALKKTKVIESSLTNLHNSQNAMLWRFGKNICWLHTGARKYNLNALGTYFECEGVKRT